MKFKTVLLSATLISFAGVANAAEDFTGSLYLPGQGKLLSDTSLAVSRTKFKSGAGGGAENAMYLNQYLTYGVTNEFSVVGAIGNHFNYQNKSGQRFNNDKNLDYTIGGKYNFGYDKVVGQVGLSYYTYDPKDWYGRSTPEKWSKNFDANVQLGYKLPDELTPYTSLTAHNRDSFTADRSTDYSWFVGAHKTFSRCALDAGLRYDFTTYGNNTNNLYAQAEANYFVTERVALGVFGDYLLGGTGTDNVKYDYTAGINAKILFF